MATVITLYHKPHDLLTANNHHTMSTVITTHTLKMTAFYDIAPYRLVRVIAQKALIFILAAVRT
jgi:hypothetical protein